MSARRPRLGALGGFSGITIALLLTSLVSVPALIVALGAPAWADLSVVQAVAGVAAVLVVFGWGVTGPAAIAAASDAERWAAFQDSAAVRLVLFALAVPVASVVALLSTRLGLAVCVLGVVANLLPALGAGWFFVGVADARASFLLDALPRIAASLLGIVLATLTRSVVAYLLVQTAGGLVLVAGSYIGIRVRHGYARRVTVRRLRAVVAEQSGGVLTAAMGAAYTSVPVVFVGAVGGPGRDQLLFAFRILRIAIAGITPMTQFFQGWVPRREVSAAEQRRRMVLSLRAVAVVSVVVVVAIAALLPFASAVVSSGQIFVSERIALPVAIAVGAIAVSQTTGLVCLVALRRVPAVAFSTGLGAAVGVLLMFTLHAVLGIPGVAWSVAAAEVAVLAWQCAALRRAFPAAAASAAPHRAEVSSTRAPSAV